MPLYTPPRKYVQRVHTFQKHKTTTIASSSLYKLKIYAAPPDHFLTLHHISPAYILPSLARPPAIHPRVSYKGTSLTGKRNPLGPYRRPVPRVLGGWAFSYGRGTPVHIQPYAARAPCSDN